MIDLTPEEQRAIDSLKRLAKRWPASLWLFSNGMQIYIMKKDDKGNHSITPEGGIDSAYVVDSVQIDADGGDW